MAEILFDLLTALEEKSEEYNELIGKWNKTRIIYKGEDAVHEAGSLLLDPLEQQDPKEFVKYVNRTRFLNVFKRTVSGLEGSVKRKPPLVEIKGLEDFEEDVDSSGTTLIEYSNRLLHEGIKVGVSATLVDYNYTFSNEDENELTVAQAEEMNLRPKLCFYPSDDIYKVEYGVVNGKRQIILVVLKETYKKRLNEFQNQELDQYRVLRINDDGDYEIQLYKVEDTTGKIEPSEPIIPEVDGNSIQEIPFFIHGEFIEPPLYDLVTNNVKHYQLKADHNHVLHFIGLPTIVRTGVDPSDKNLPTTIGPCIWDIEQKDARVFYLELQGVGIKNITEELDAIKEEMAFLGAAILASDQMVNETATKANLRNASETASLVDIVVNLSETFTKALKFFSLWHGKESDDILFEYNKDFDVTRLSADDIIKRVQAWQSGGFSKRSLHKQLREGEVELEGEDFEEEEGFINTGV